MSPPYRSSEPHFSFSAPSRPAESPTDERPAARIRCAVAALLLVIATTGCPHRSPLWSPDGRHVLVLTGMTAEPLDRPASRLFLVDVEKGAATPLLAPTSGSKFLTAVWIDATTFLVATGFESGDTVTSGSERWWKAKVGVEGWTESTLPAPSGSRVMRRPPILVSSEKRGATLVYPEGVEDVIAVRIADAEVIYRASIAETVGALPGGAALIQRENDLGSLELVALNSDLGERWTRRFSALREDLAKEFEVRAVDIVFNDASTTFIERSPAPSSSGTENGGQGAIGVVLCFSDVSWKDGVPGYYARLDAATGRVLGSARGRGLPGAPSSLDGTAWYVPAPDGKKTTTIQLLGVALGSSANSTTEPPRSISLPVTSREGLQGYSADPSGKTIAVALPGETPELWIFEIADPTRVGAEPRRIRLEGRKSP
jgi:hypothetical protein